MSPRVPKRPTRFGEEVIAMVRAQMGRDRVTQADLSRTTGIVQSTLSRILSGKSPVTIDDLELIARELDMDLGELLDGAATSIGQLPTANATLRSGSREAGLPQLRAADSADHDEGPR